MSREDLFTASVERLLETHATPRHIRDIETSGDARALWSEIEQAGFADALVPEEKGGAGLGLSDVFGVVAACGAHAAPVPLAFTMIARSLLAEARLDIPSGPVTLAPFMTSSLDCPRVPYGRVAQWVLAKGPDGWMLLGVKDGEVSPTGVHASLEADIRWSVLPKDAKGFAPSADVMAAAACLLAAQIAGALDTVFAMTVRHANDRSQFGKPIGKFQAIQQQISVMAEHVFAARMAAEMGCASPTFAPLPLLAAVAKARASEAVVPVAAIAHAVHGALGVTQEFDLQLYTRRLHEWRAAFGAESHWSRQVGEALLEEEAGGSLDFIRTRLFPAIA
jgi:acyl-CoA dehydrogenase